MMTVAENLRIIESFDPDGFEFKPRPDDYRIFKSWVITRYGQDMWNLYSTARVYPEV